jgi:hypothetical protein
MEVKAKTMNPDTSVLLDQIEEARRRLMLTIRSCKQTSVLAQLANDVDASIQDCMDEIIDGATSNDGHSRGALRAAA